MCVARRQWIRRGMVCVSVVLVAACHSDATAPDEPITASIDQKNFAISKCQLVQLTVTTVNPAGTVVTPDSVRWVSGDTTLATVSRSGVVHALRSTPRVTVEALVFRGSLRASAQVSFAISEPAILPPIVCAP